MARLAFDGLDSLMDDLDSLAHLPDRVVEDVLNAGADVLVPAQRAEISSRWRGRFSEGISAKSVKKSNVKKTKEGGAAHIYPQGTRKRGKKRIRNAEVAFINEYGAPKRGIAPRPAIAAANAKAEQAAADAGERVFNAYLDSKNL